MSSCNGLTQKVTREEKSNESVTINCDSLPRSQQEFLRRAIRINQQEGKPWSYLDFPQITRGNFRQIVRRLGDKIEIVIKGKPTFYKVKGIEIPGDSRRVTFRPTGVCQDLIDILESLKYQPAAIHDIKLKVNAKLHDALITKGTTPDPCNKVIRVNIPVSDNFATVKALVYPETIQIDIGCTYRPIVYDITSLLELYEMLVEVSIYLRALSGVVLPHVKDWIATHYHLNKDGSRELNGQSFHFTVNDIVSGVTRYYSKKMPDGKVVPRLERILTPKLSLEEEIVKAANSMNLS